MIKIYTDGSSTGKVGDGGWAFIVTENENVKYIKSGFAENTTNNKMELTAILESLKFIKEKLPTEILIYSDSQYCVNGITDWLMLWKSNNWKSAKGDVKNQDLWKEIDSILPSVKIDMVWIRGHHVNEFNNLTDKQAVLARKTKTPKDFRVIDNKY
jgi:ribonuclease HI